MNLEQWLIEEHDRLERFARQWRQSQIDDPEHYPGKLDPGEWDEQYRAFEGA